MGDQQTVSQRVREMEVKRKPHICKHCMKRFVRPFKWERTYPSKEGWHGICGRCAGRLDRLKYDGSWGMVMLSSVSLRRIEPQSD